MRYRYIKMTGVRKAGFVHWLGALQAVLNETFCPERNV